MADELKKKIAELEEDIETLCEEIEHDCEEWCSEQGIARDDLNIGHAPDEIVWSFEEHDGMVDKLHLLYEQEQRESGY